MPNAPMILKPDEDEILHLREIQLVHDACLELAHQIRERRPQTIARGVAACRLCLFLLGLFC